MWERIKTWWLRKQARCLYADLRSKYNSVTCGASLLEYMNPAVKFQRKRLMAMCRLLRRREMQPVPVRTTR